ncbi:HAMP domain-containing histidine kinase [Deinococcus sp. HMF7604]|uniref:sensor histidine kinase n=1 Tax=Deinococcus betulae TaxID=2873312 RepID=UPI001CCE85F2|nr:HAMP domain-containing sensor histidine kinase [Deinococcus betulae]MBZ9752845.1 HAMP domain-containing histidine kinase [Deinococcus betulae]
MIALITLLDILTPASLVVATLLSAPLALAALGLSRSTTFVLLGLILASNVIAGWMNALRDGMSTTDLGNRLVSMLAAILVAGLTLRARQVSLQAAQLAEEERRLTRERGLRTLVEAVSGPFGQAEFVSRAAEALRTLAGAQVVEIGSVDRAMLREPHAISPSDGVSRLGTRLSLEALTQPAGVGPVWAVSGGDVLLARLSRPLESDLLLLLTRPTAPLDVVQEAVQTLQPLLDRTALLDDIHARQAQLQARGEVLQDLIYAFSHDLRTPLLANAVNIRSALKGAYGPLPDAYCATLRNGLEANATLLSLADQLLLVAKYESGETDDEAQSVNLREVILGVLAQLQGPAADRSITFETELEGVTVPGRKHDVRRAVQNLLENALKFSPANSVIRVTLQHEGDEAALRVLDQGPGVPPGREATLFQRFRSGGAGGGTGLGLYLTRRIAEGHGGHVTYHRTVRAQSVFTLTLPLETL